MANAGVHQNRQAAEAAAHRQANVFASALLRPSEIETRKIGTINSSAESAEHSKEHAMGNRELRTGLGVLLNKINDRIRYPAVVFL